MNFHHYVIGWNLFVRSVTFKRVIMRTQLVLLAVFLLMLQLSAHDLKAQRITLNTNRSSLGNVLKEISKQTGYDFLYNPELLRNNAVPVTLERANVSLEEGLKVIFDKQPNLAYTIDQKTVIIRPKKAQPTAVKTVELQQGVQGRVTDQQGEPLQGVNIKVKGTTIAAMTDSEGRYTFGTLAPNSILVFSYLGYATQEVAIGTRREIAVVLENLSTDLEEVVVAYGVQKRVSVTGAVSSVDVEKLEQSSASNLGAALAGRLSGLTSLQTGGGQPGRDNATLFLRGISTLNDASPLIIVDGVPRDNIRQIDPSEIASVSTLKDASATAVFGVRGANGVIMITTKRGSKGRAKVRLRGEQSYTSFAFEPEHISSLEFLRMQNEAAKNDGLPEPIWSPEVVAKYENPLLGLDPDDPNYELEKKKREYMYPNHDYYREFIKRFTPETRFNADISGGGDKLRYYMNAGFINQDGNFNTEPKSQLGYDPSLRMQRYRFRGNLDYEVSKSFSAFLNISSNIETVNMPYLINANSMEEMILNAQHIWPITPGPTTIEGFGPPAGMVVDVPYLTNTTFEAMNRRGYTRESTSLLNSSLGLAWDLSEKITPGLRVSGMASIDTRSRSTLNASKKEVTYISTIDHENDDLQFVVNNDSETLLNLTKAVASRYTVNLQGKIDYNRQFNKHNVGGMVLGQRDSWESYTGEIPFNVISIATRFTYGYDNRYFAEVNMGYNGSEQFAPQNRFGFFPAFSAGWVLSNERFLANHPVITNLKLRASYGKVGNDKIGTARFLYIDNNQMGAGPLGSLGNGRGIAQGLLGNPTLQWEEATKQNYAIDLGIKNNLEVSFDYYRENRSNILITRGLVPALGGVRTSNLPKANMGIVHNQGFEIEFKYRQPFGTDFILDIQGNYGYSKNKVVYADEPQLEDDYVHQYRSTGYNIGQVFGYQVDWASNGGYWVSREEIADSDLSYDFGNPRPGDFKYIDQNGDGVINAKDLVPLGYSSRIPRNIFGLNLRLQYKNIDFTTFIQGVSRYTKHFNGQGVYESSKSGMYFGFHRQAWTEERYQNGESITYPALTLGTSTSHQANDFFVMDRSYLRLRNIEIGFNMPAGVLERLGGIAGLRVYANGQNIFTWHGLKMNHLDPDVTISTPYPTTKMWNMGCSVTF